MQSTERQHMIHDALHEQMANIGAQVGPLETFAQANGLIDTGGRVE